MIYFISISLFMLANGLWILSKKREYRKSSIFLFQVISFGSLLLFSGCRGLAIGTDTSMYVRCFENMNGFSDYSLYSWRFEPGYRFFMSLISTLWNDAHALLFISSLVTLVLFFILCKKRSTVPWYSIMIFVFLMYYYNSMCLLRQYIAIMIIGIAFNFLGDKKYVNYILFTLLAISFHSSAAITFVILPLTKLKLTKNRRWIYIICALACAFLFNEILVLAIKILPQYANYITSDYYQENQLGVFLKILMWFVLFLVVSSTFNGLVEKDREDTWNKIEYLCALLALIITITALNGAILERMGIYFSFLFCISIPNSLQRLKKRKLKYQWAFVILLGCIVYNLVIFMFRPYWSGVLPYVFWN